MRRLTYFINRPGRGLSRYAASGITKSEAFAIEPYQTLKEISRREKSSLTTIRSCNGPLRFPGVPRDTIRTTVNVGLF
jgi:hypothetical protein